MPTQRSLLDGNTGQKFSSLELLVGAAQEVIASLVTSVFGRTGDVVAQDGDYNSTQVTNSSGVVGSSVTAALNSLAASIAALVTGVSSVFGRAGAVVAQSGDYNSTQVTNSSGVTGSSVTAALNSLNTKVRDLVAIGLRQNPGNTTQGYIGTIIPSSAPVTNATQASIQVGVPTTYTMLRVKQAAALATDSMTFNLYVDGVAQAGTAVVMPAGTTQNNVTTFASPVVVAAGSVVAIGVLQSGTQGFGDRLYSVVLSGYPT